jgi:hypothetical protein
LPPFSLQLGLRMPEVLFAALQQSWVQNTLVVLIVLNAAILGLETSNDLMLEWGVYLLWIRRPP